jgi:inosine/xanthosine triphosphate pyrophosphatase family protein
MKILIATTNEGKIAEFRSLLSDERLEFTGSTPSRKSLTSKRRGTRSPKMQS